LIKEIVNTNDVDGTPRYKVRYEGMAKEDDKWVGADQVTEMQIEQFQAKFHAAKAGGAASPAKASPAKAPGAVPFRSAGRKNRVPTDSDETESASAEEERSPAAACAAPAGGAAANIDSLLDDSSDSDGDIADFRKKKVTTNFMKSSQGAQANQQTRKPGSTMARCRALGGQTRVSDTFKPAESAAAVLGISSSDSDDDDILHDKPKNAKSKKAKPAFEVKAHEQSGNPVSGGAGKRGAAAPAKPKRAAKKRSPKEKKVTPATGNSSIAQFITVNKWQKTRNKSTEDSAAASSQPEPGRARPMDPALWPKEETKSAAAANPDLGDFFKKPKQAAAAAAAVAVAR
jgi:hypothetical protein